MVLNKLHGIIVPLSTPIKEDQSIDFPATKNLVDKLIENGVDGLFPLSGTGEFPMLSLRESKQFINFVMRSSSGRVPVYPGAFRDNLGDTLELAFAAEISGAEGIVLMPPYFYGRIKSEDIVDQVRRIKCNINLPVIFYNTNSKLRLDEASMLRLHQEGLVIGAKEGSKDLDYLKRLAESGMSVLPGSDKLLYAASQFGCVGGFPGSANVLTKGFVTLWKFIQEEKLQEAEALQSRISSVVEVMYKTNPYSAQTGVKIGLEYLGICLSRMKYPMPQATTEEKRIIFETLDKNKDLL
ncbi:MAG TPA: dihydrodipicolinate synthase family protein [Candidatus Nanoarchaeia archaeon]|nr:dihydrodipicolinate synthase family protein [Candidatus Nanoarchaeia archaeon]